MSKIFCYFYEKIKLFLNDYKNINNLFVFCEKNKHEFKELFELFLEAQIVALLIMDQPLKALKKGNQCLEEVNENFIPLFILRIVDIFLYMKQQIQKAKKYISEVS